MNPDLIQQMSTELREVRDRYKAFLDAPFMADLETYAAASQRTCNKQRQAAGILDPALDLHLKNTSNLMGEIIHGNLFAEAYGHAIGAVRERYDELDRKLAAQGRHEDAIAQAEARAGGLVSSAHEPNPDPNQWDPRL